MIRQELYVKSHNDRNYLLLKFLLLTILCYPYLANSQTYNLSVGESVTVTQSENNGGYIDNVGLADFIDPHLSFTKNYDGSAKITVKSYFDYTVTVKLVFIEKYQSYYSGRYHTHAATYYKNVNIKCNYEQPSSSVKPTKVILPERVRVYTNSSERYYIEAILEPYGAKGTSYEWYNDQGTATFAARNMTDGRCWVTGRSPGIGRVSVVVDEDWENLYASTVLEVVDPNNPPPTSVFLFNEIEISVNGSCTLTPLLIPENAATSYSWTSKDEQIATVSYGKITGKKAGTTTITVTTSNYLKAECLVKVVSNGGKDDEDDSNNNSTGTVDGYNYVDLGLSVKWASYNVGAKAPEEFGGYYAWGETSEKTTYSKDTYNSISRTYNTDIKGTNHDVAHTKWGNKWRMPTDKEFSELFIKCTCSEETINGVEGCRLTGPNGASIFFPFAGRKDDGKTYQGIYIWTSIPRISDTYWGKAYQAFYQRTNVMAVNNNGNRWCGYSIRPVTEYSENKPIIKVTNISLNSSTATLDVGETYDLLANVIPDNATDKSVKWSSNNINVATVSTTGLVTANSPGTATITCKATDGSGVSATCSIIVNDKSKIVLSASPSGGEVAVGSSVTLTATSGGSIVSADIYYTLNGYTPSRYSTMYKSSGITINESCILKAIAYKDGYEDSEVLTVMYTAKYVPTTFASKTSSAGYATFYSSESAYVLPNGLSAQVLTEASNNKLAYKTIAVGSVSGVIPKGTAVMLVSDNKQAGTFTLTASESTATYTGMNLLHGSDEATTTTGDGYHYKLSYGPSETDWSDVFGWYWGAANGSAFQIEGHKAWLVVPKAAGTRAFSLDGETMGIETIVNGESATDSWYDLQGRRINQPARKGIYIKNGKKYINK